MPERSSEMPPRTGFTCPSRLVPAPKGVTGTPWWWHRASRRLTSSVVCTKATASGGVGVVLSSPLPCCRRMLSFTESRSPRKPRASLITAATLLGSARGPGRVTTFMLAYPRPAPAGR